MKFSSFHVFYRYDKPEIKKWAGQIRQQLSGYTEDSNTPDLVIVLGGDGAILEAARLYSRSMLLGFNFGTRGFLASVDKAADLAEVLSKLKSGNFHISARTMIKVRVKRADQTVFECSGLNEAVVNSLIGVVDLSICIDGEEYESIHGTGAIVATATGSTAYNLSAGGPIVVPELPALIVTELLDHDISTPSLVVRSEQIISIIVERFRKTGRLKITETDEPTDVVLDVDGANLWALKAGDVVEITEADTQLSLIEIEPGYFLKNIRNSFSL